MILALIWLLTHEEGGESKGHFEEAGQSTPPTCNGPLQK